ncbi:MAG TPA: LCP family protein [Nitriliruptorales bacterium]|nr:LCP family protein [Nitriliruptorales bacterium]
MATVVTVMDRGTWVSNTDIIVVVDPARRRLLWVPRDVWSPAIAHRINKAFAVGGHDVLRTCLAALGIETSHGICLRREATEHLLAEAVVTVRVERPLRLWYPIEPTARIEDGRKPVDFDPPAETLSGERIHQWIGARYSRAGPSSDLDRIRRQQVLLRGLLRARFPLGAALDDPRYVRVSSGGAVDDVRRIRSWWRFRCLSGLRPDTIDGKMVLVRP